MAPAPQLCVNHVSHQKSRVKDLTRICCGCDNTEMGVHPPPTPHPTASTHTDKLTLIANHPSGMWHVSMRSYDPKLDFGKRMEPEMQKCLLLDIRGEASSFLGCEEWKTSWNTLLLLLPPKEMKGHILSFFALHFLTAHHKDTHSICLFDGCVIKCTGCTKMQRVSVFMTIFQLSNVEWRRQVLVTCWLLLLFP